jgi:ABC-type antimicrobial peptide transport system permease subunit
VFGILALSIAVVGLYGVLAHFVTERTPEIGIRRALGALGPSVVALVFRQSIGPVLTGLLVGLTGSFIGARYLASLLFGTDAHDPASFFGSGVAFMVAAPRPRVTQEVWEP